MSKTILITGASTGIGKATAKYFQARGWNVVATMRTPEQETELTQLDNVLVTRLDVLDSASIETSVAAGLSRFGKIDVLLNNAGYGAYGPLEASSMERVRRQFDVNVMGLIETTKAVLPHFRARHEGFVVNVSSIGGKITIPLGSLYHSTKFAIEGFSEALHYELAAIGVRVKIIEPGAIKTDFANRSFDFQNDPDIPEYQPMVQSLFSSFEPFLAEASLPELVAEVIYQAVTDGSEQMRYEVGADATAFLTARRSLDDAAFFDNMKSQFCPK